MLLPMLQAPCDLTLPKPNSTTARRLLGVYLKWSLQELKRIPPGRFASPIFTPFARARTRLLQLLSTPNAGLAYAIIRRPSISVLIRCIHRELWGDGDVAKLDKLLSQLGALLWLELSFAGQLPEGDLPALVIPAGELVLANFGVVLSSRAAYEVQLRPEAISLKMGDTSFELTGEALAGIGTGNTPRLETAAFEVERVRFPFTENTALVIADNNPLASHEAHPDKNGNEIDLGGKTTAAWVSTLTDAFALIEAHYAELAQEIQLVMHAYHPVGFDPERHLSASYAEAIGSAYLSLHPDLMTMLEAMIHEFSHNKLNALFSQDKILHNAFEPLFSSPVRPDPRPLYGVLLAVHAFVPVAEVYRRMQEQSHPLSQEPGFKRRYLQVIQKNLDGIATLKANANPTPQGRLLLDELENWASAQTQTLDAP